jgi:hypothetical protein
MNINMTVKMNRKISMMAAILGQLDIGRDLNINIVSTDR